MKKLFLLFLLSTNTFGGEIYRGAPNILEECLDAEKPKQIGVYTGPSARARECTRLYCNTAEYQEKVKQYALSIQQSEKDAREALTCVMRKEQDLRN